MGGQMEGQQAYSNYRRSFSGSYYACIGTGAGYFNPGNFPQLAGHPLQCSTAVGNWRDQVSNQHTSHELRLSTSADYRVRALLRLFFEKFVIDDDMNFNYLGIPQGHPANLASALARRPACLSALVP